MPNFAVESVPVQISQSGTQEALIRNTGDAPVFLDAQSSVNALNSGLELQPFDSVNWPQGRDLWAVCAPGTESTVSVLYGASGVSLGAVSAVVTGDVTATIDGPVSIAGTIPVDIQNATIDATITGDVNVLSGEVNVGGILTPVVIQGGGQNITSIAGPLLAGASTAFAVPVPGNGQTYYAYRIDFQVTSAAVAGANQVLRYTDTFSNQTYVVNPQTANTTQIGRPQRHVFTIPAGAGTFNITITNVGTVTADMYISIDGLNVSSPTPQTDMGILLTNHPTITVTPPTVAPEYHVWYPASFQPYNCLLRTNSSSGFINVMRQTYVGSAGAVAVYNTYTTRAWNVPGYPDYSQLSNTAIGAVVSRFIPVTGNGQPCRFEFAVSGSNSGSAEMAIIS